MKTVIAVFIVALFCAAPARAEAEGALHAAGGQRCAMHETPLPEMKVLTTWMRLCGKLLSITDETKWSDEIEKTFYNAYLAGLSRDGSTFDSYGTLGVHQGAGAARARRPLRRR